MESPHVSMPPTDPWVVLRDGVLPRHRLLTLEWERLSRGLYRRRDAQMSMLDTARAVSEVLPRESGFGHLTNAALRGWWLPNRLRGHVMLATTRSGVHVQRRGLYVRRSRVAGLEYIDGVPVVSAPHALVELAADLSLVDLVPLVDCALRDGVDPSAILAAIPPRRPGAPRLRQAVELADERSESWWESVLRLLHVLPGLGPVESQVPLYDDGVFIACADLHLVGTTRFPECDGAEHRRKERHERDLRRDKGMSRRRFERYGYTTGEIAGTPAMIIRDAEEARGWPHDPGRVREWWRHARVSSLTPYGRTLLGARLERYRLAAERGSTRRARRTGEAA
jgi:hypothetical protein